MPTAGNCYPKTNTGHTVGHSHAVELVIGQIAFGAHNAPNMRPRRSRSTEFTSPTWYHDWQHRFFATILYKAEGKPSVRRLYCSSCERVFFEGQVKNLRDRIRFHIAEDTAMQHHELGHEVVFVTPERAI